MTLAARNRPSLVPDNDLMRRFNRWRAPVVPVVDASGNAGGDGWLWGVDRHRRIVAPDVSDDRSMRFRALGAAACAVTCGILLFHKVKRLVCQVRPRDVEPHCWAHIVTRDKFSFPSGHSTTAFAVAVSLGSFYPEIMPVLLVLAANVAISRVVVGMHFLSDVLVGSGAGALLGYAAFAAFRIAV